MCKGCRMSDTVGYLEEYSAPFERAASDIKDAYTWLNQEAHKTSNAQKKKHQVMIVRRLKLVAQELNEIRSLL